MTATVFVDTNVLIYTREAGDPARQQRALLWMEGLWAGKNGRVSFQVLHEYFAKLFRKCPDLQEQVRADIRDLLSWRPVSLDAAILESAWKIQDRYRLSFRDALIVAAARASSCRWLLTEDLQADQTIDGVIVVNPFQRTPDQLPDL